MKGITRLTVDIITNDYGEFVSCSDHERIIKELRRITKKKLIIATLDRLEVGIEIETPKEIHFTFYNSAYEELDSYIGLESSLDQIINWAMALQHEKTKIYIKLKLEES